MSPTQLLRQGETATDKSGEIVSTSDYDFTRLTGRLCSRWAATPASTFPTPRYGSGASDWVEGLAGKAVYVANTGFGYADGNVVGLTERLLGLYANRIGGTLTAGQALMYAKNAYLGGLGLYTNYDEKIMQEATFYGLPMYRSTTRRRRRPIPASCRRRSPGTNYSSASFDFDPTFDSRTVDGETVTTVDGEDPQVSPDYPLLPRTSQIATNDSGAPAHDALITELDHLGGRRRPGDGNARSSAPGDRSRLCSSTTSRSRPSFTNVTTYETPDGPRQDLVLLPARVRAQTDPVTGETTGTIEKFTHTGVEVFYSASSDRTRPTITTPTATRSGSDATFTMRPSTTASRSSASWCSAADDRPADRGRCVSSAGVARRGAGRSTSAAAARCAGSPRPSTTRAT